MIFETHAHYEDKAFDEDRKALLSSLKEKEIEYVVNVGSTIGTSRASVELSKEYDYIYAAVGIHPSEIKDHEPGDIDEIEKLASTNEKVKAIGEIGLDYHWDKDNKEEQKLYFSRQIQTARRLKLPIIVHSREAALDTYTTMKNNQAELCGGVVHCFSYSKEEAAKYLDMGFYLGIGGVVTFKKAITVKEVVQYAPLDRILLETDCPYMAPEPHRGERNSSLYLPLVVAQIAQIKGISEQEVISVTAENARKMYKIGE